MLRTYDPPLTALEGREVTAVRRHGAFLDLETAGGPHFVAHLARTRRPATSTGPGSPHSWRASAEPETQRLYEAPRTTLTEAVERSRGAAVGRLKAGRKSGLRVHGRQAPGGPQDVQVREVVRRSGPGSPVRA